MSRRSTKAENALFAAVAIVSIPVFLAIKIFESVGWVIPTLVVVLTMGAS
jgi:hypothetical protein